VVHEWWGHDQFSRDQAEKLAQAGYTAMAVDMYGEGKSADHPEKAKAFMKEANSDMEAMKTGFRTAMKRLQDHETVDPDRIAAQGYCFGGAVVLNMARMGLDLTGLSAITAAWQVPLKLRLAISTHGFRSTRVMPTSSFPRNRWADSSRNACPLTRSTW